MTIFSPIQMESYGGSCFWTRTQYQGIEDEVKLLLETLFFHHPFILLSLFYSFIKPPLSYLIRDELGVMRAADWKGIKAQLGFYYR